MTPNAERLRQIEDVFHRVRVLPAEQQPAALAESCAGDDDLQSEVGSLLAHAAATGPQLDLALMAADALPPPGNDPNLGQHVGPYELQKRLGAGGMGSVYLAVQTEPVRRTVAVKLIRRGLDTEEVVRRFEQERQVLASLNHPNIARLLDGGSTDDDLPFFVMEYVEGEPIDSWCDRQNLDTLARLRLFQRVCDAVHFAHQNTVIHRDLKPANILVTRDGTPKLVDFGIAKLMCPDASAASLDVTRTEYRFMTPEYASPEQIRGDTITTASDVYSLGVVLYELLTGHRPHAVSGRRRQDIERATDDDTEPSRPSDAVRRRTEQRRGTTTIVRTPETISRTRGVSPDRLRRQLRDDLDNIILMAIRNDPNRRYASAEQMSADIGRCLRQEPVLAVPPSMLYRLVKFARRNKTACALIVAMVFGLVGTTVGGIWAARARDAARQAERTATERAERLRRAVYRNQIALAQSAFAADDVAGMRRSLAVAPIDLREWEWEHLHAAADDSLQTWRGHENTVLCLAFSLDGRFVVSGGVDETVRIWQASSGTELKVLRGHGGDVTSVACSHDGRWVVSGSMDKTAIVWDVQAGSEVRRLRHPGAVMSVRFSRDGTRIATGGDDRTIRLWDAHSGAELRTLHGYDGLCDSLAFSADGRWLAAGGEAKTVKVWDVLNGATLRSLARHTQPVVRVAFSTDGRLMASAGRDRTITIWQTNTWSIWRNLPGAEWSGSAIDFSPRLRRVAMAGTKDHLLRVGEVGKGIFGRRLRGHDKRIRAVAFDPSGQRIVTAGIDGTLRVWDAEGSRDVTRFSGHSLPVSCLTFNSGSTIVVSGSADGTLVFWDAEGRTSIRAVPAHGGKIVRIAFLPGGQNVMSAGGDGMVRIWDATTGLARQTFRCPPDSLECMATAPVSRQLVTGGNDGVIRVRSADSGHEILTMPGHRGTVRAVAFSPDGRSILSAGDDGTVRIWDSATGAPVRTLRGHRGAVRAVAASRVDGRIVSAGKDATIRVWDANTRSPIQTMRGHDGAIAALAFHPDGRRIASASADKTVKLWDPDAGAEVLTLRGFTAPVTCVEFSPDGRTLVAGSEDQTVRIWDTTRYADHRALQRAAAERRARVTERVDEWYNRERNWRRVVQEVRRDPSLSPAERQDAVKEVLARAADQALVTGTWTVSFFRLELAKDLAKLSARWNETIKRPPILRMQWPEVQFVWRGSPPAGGVPADHFGVVATTVIRTEAGRYRVGAVSDDGVRVWVDNRLVIDNWTIHAPTRDRAYLDLTAGEHTVRVEYFDWDRDAILKVHITPVPPTSNPVTTGSAKLMLLRPNREVTGVAAAA